MQIQHFFDPHTYTLTYIVIDVNTKRCAIIDSVLDFDPASGRTHTTSADQLIEYINARDLSCDWILETHVHADHISAAPYLQERLGAKIAIGNHIVDVQGIFAELFNAEPEFARDGSQFGQLLADGDSIQVGGLTLNAMHTPGHTPACMSYQIEDAVFVGDTLFQPDFGTARCDFPGGSAETLWDSVQKILSLPDETRVFTGHDYQPGGRDMQYMATVAEHKANNIHLQGDKTSFVQMRNERDATLNMPTLIFQSVQTNMRAGEMPPAEENGIRYLKIPVNAV
jgi:glyoxylase-like metal-dependent hydrolase (beta-lactamase superfamily II)